MPYILLKYIRLSVGWLFISTWVLGSTTYEYTFDNNGYVIKILEYSGSRLESTYTVEYK